MYLIYPCTHLNDPFIIYLSRVLCLSVCVCVCHNCGTLCLCYSFSFIIIKLTKEDETEGSKREGLETEI
jgi:hypothetical protein